jgi:hypothetical protein
LENSEELKKSFEETDDQEQEEFARLIGLLAFQFSQTVKKTFFTEEVDAEED